MNIRRCKISEVEHLEVFEYTGEGHQVTGIYIMLVPNKRVYSSTSDLVFNIEKGDPNLIVTVVGKKIHQRYVEKV